MTRGERIGSVVAGVIAQAVRDADAEGVVLLDDGYAEAGLAHGWCVEAVGADRVWPVSLEPGAAEDAGVDALPVEVLASEALRFRARLLAAARGALLVHPANKTALLLGAMPPEPLLPLGDLYASEVADLAGGWSAPEPIPALAEAAGGIERLDAALRALVDHRYDESTAFRDLPDGLGRAVSERLEAGRFARRRVGLVPKLGARTLGIDLFA